MAFGTVGFGIWIVDGAQDYADSRAQAQRQPGKIMAAGELVHPVDDQDHAAAFLVIFQAQRKADFKGKLV